MFNFLKRSFLSSKLLIAWVVCLFAHSCSSGDDSSLNAWMFDKNKIKVLSTTAMIDSLVGAIGGEKIVHIPLIFGEIDPHSYELVKGDGEKFAQAGVVFANGLGLEHGASVRYQLERHPNAIFLGDIIQKQNPEKIIHIDHQVDPHLWMDISLWSLCIDPICEALCKIDPEGAKYYQTNAAALREVLLKRDIEIYSTMQDISEKKRYLVTSHDAFNYFARRYLATPQEEKNNQWRKRFEAPEGLAPDGQLSALDIHKIVHHLQEYGIRVIFPESNVSRDSLKKIMHVCRQKGIQVRIAQSILYGDAMGAADSDTNTYEHMISHNANAMMKEWDHE